MEEEIYLNVIYSEFAELGITDIDRTYITEKIGVIYDDEKQIGTVKFTIIHLTQAIDNQINTFEIFDNHSDYLSRVGKLVHKFDEKLDNYAEHKFTYDIIVIEKIEIQEKYRGKNISILVLNDILFRYSYATKFFIIEAFPLNGIDLSEKEIKLAQSKLIKHYKKAGFENIKGINKRYLFSL